jgi:hypothetical protein
MIAPTEEAFSLLRKWFAEKTLLKVMLISPNGSLTVRVMGFIFSLSPQSILIGDHSDRTEAPRHYIEINRAACRFYDYLEVKNINGESERAIAGHHGIAGLSIVLSDNSRFSLFEEAGADFSTQSSCLTEWRVKSPTHAPQNRSVPGGA